MDEPQVLPDDIERAARRIEGLIRRTPVIAYDGLTLKLELLQHAGSFKPRGAANRLLAERERGALAAAGVVADSVPEMEWKETEAKARALLRAAELVEEGLM